MRLTYKYEDSSGYGSIKLKNLPPDPYVDKLPYLDNAWKEQRNKLGQLEDIEEALTHGFYYKDYTENDEIRFSGNCFIQVNNYLVETKPCYAVKETTLYSCYNPLGYPSETKEVKDAHYWSWKTCLHFKIEDYGKTWALTREELE